MRRSRPSKYGKLTEMKVTARSLGWCQNIQKRKVASHAGESDSDDSWFQLSSMFLLFFVGDITKETSA